MNIDTAPKVPSVIKDEVKYRGPATSHNYNFTQEAIAFDLVNLYNLVNTYSETLTEVGVAHVIENLYSQGRINQLEYEFMIMRAKCEDLGHSFDLNRDRTKHIYVLPERMYTEEDMNYPANIDLIYRQVNLPRFSQIYKLYLYNEVDGRITIPDTLKIDITPKPDNLRVFDNGFEKCLNGNQHEFWIRRIINNKDSAVETIIELELPDTIIASRDINCLEFQTYPYHSLDIMSIEYKVNAGWRHVPGFKSYWGVQSEIKWEPPNINYEVFYIQYAENVKLCFGKTPMSRLRIKLRQRTYIEEHDNRIFYLGFKHFNLKNEIVNTKYCEFAFDIEFDMLEEEPKIITGFIPTFNNAAVLSDNSPEMRSLIQYEIFGVDQDGAMEYVSGAPLSVEHGKYHIKTKMHYDQEAGCNPSLRMIDVQYQLVSDYNNIT